MRPCSNCRGTDTAALPTGLLPKLAAVFGNSPAMVAYVCRTCRHIDVWLDEVAMLPQEEAAAATELAPA